MELNWVLNICLAMLTPHQVVQVPAKEDPVVKVKQKETLNTPTLQT